MHELIEDVLSSIDESIATKEVLRNDAKNIAEAGIMVSNCINNGGKVLFFGNGGSAADAQHISAELIGRYLKNRRGLPSIALTTNSSVLTAVANDFDYASVFERQVDALVQENDVVIGISTSGNSPNVLRGLAAAKRMRAHTIALTGKTGGKIGENSDITIHVPSQNIQRIQECHILIGHIICDIVEKNLSKIFLQEEVK